LPHAGASLPAETDAAEDRVIPPADDEEATPPEDEEVQGAADSALGLDDEDADASLPDDGAKSTSWGCPDLVLIDGGAGQLSAAHEVLDALGLPDITLIGIAKGPDRNLHPRPLVLHAGGP
jgi:hypothetical protein